MNQESEEQKKPEQELGVLSQKLQAQKQPKKKNYLNQEDEDVEVCRNEKTGEIDSQSIQNQQYGNGFIQKLFPGFECKSFTCGFVMIFLITFIIMGYMASKLELPQRHPMYGEIQDQFVTIEMGCTLQRYGGRFTRDLKDHYGYWRLFTSIFVHGDLMQLLLNGFTFLLLGFQLEGFLGGQKYAKCLVISGFFGNILAQLIHYKNIYSGACQCTFAMFGMMAYNMKVRYAYMGEDRKTQGKNLLWVIGATFFLFFLDHQIDYLALPGSLVIGFFVSFILFNEYQKEVKWILISLILFLAYAIMVMFLIYQVEDMHKVEYPCDPWDTDKYKE